MSILELREITYTYDNKQYVLRGINAKMEAGKMYAILGPSGCGKTTLLSLLGGLDRQTAGFCLTEQILNRLVWMNTEENMFLLCFRRIT